MDVSKSPAHNQRHSEYEVGHQIDGVVDYPSYELYLDGLRAGFFKQQKATEEERGVGRELRLVVRRDRGLKDMVKM